MKRRSRTRRQSYLWVLSLIVVASMICSVLVMIRPPRYAPQPTPRPTRVIPTWTPTTRTSLTPTMAPPTLAPAAKTETATGEPNSRYGS